MQFKRRNYTTTVFILILFSLKVFGQTASYDPLHPPNTFRNAGNPYYWKNKLPYEGYWQQDVYYRIKANIDERTNIVDGELSLTYWNNSPDTLHEVFFHLYQNAFQPGSYYDNLHINNKNKPRYGKYESQGLGTEIESLQSNGKELTTQADNTILKVILDEPLTPGASIQFDIKFKTYFDMGSVRRRMKVFNSYGYKHFNGVHWYPRIAVYDKKFGWTKDQHLGREFYNNFGAYDVELTFANNYIVEATGFLQNRDEVLPDSLRQKLDITHFKDKPLNEKPGVIIEYDSTIRKTWIYHAENVHNFAFTASPVYRIGEAEWNGIKCIALVQEPHASRWQEVANFTRDVIKVYSEDFGMYGYHKIIVADAQDGMEYPMLTLCGGLYPANKGLIAHEVGHNWFYGMVGNNETYRAALDEGFTQFLTAWSLESIDGKYLPSTPPKSKYKARFSEPVAIRDQRVYWGYLSDAIKENDAPLNTHSDGFHGALRHGGGYRHVYYKMATMLYNLQYVLGDSLFLKTMQHFFNQWKFCHPYFEDMRNSMIQYSGVDLNWFFDQWLETNKNIDYKVVSVKRDKGRGTGDKGLGTGDEGQGTRDEEKRGQESVSTGKEFVYDIKFKRKGRMQMPVDFRVITVEDDTLDFHIPNQWFIKKTDAMVLEKWHGWDKLHPVHTASITTPARIKRVIIDPSERLADVYMPDNAKKPRVDVHFDSKVAHYPDWRTYKLYIRPALWWNAYDGMKAGIHFNGNYLNCKHKFDLTLWGNTRLGQGDPSRFNYNPEDEQGFDPVSYSFNYETALDKWVSGMSVFFSSKYLDGLEAYRLGFTQKILKKSSVTFYMKLMTRPKAEKVNYLLYPDEWLPEMINNSLNLAWNHHYSYSKGGGHINMALRSSALASDYDFHYLSMSAINYTNLWRFQLRTRVFGRYGTGSNVASESALFFAQANNEEMMEYAFIRSVGFIPPGWVGSFGDNTNHFHHGGGLNMRGYAGYLVAERGDNDVVYNVYKGNSGASVNIELDFDGLIKLRPKWFKDVFHLDSYLFADAGTIVYEDSNGDQTFSSPRLDAGAGIALTIKRFGPLQKVKPLTFRFDIPFYVSHAPFVSDNIAFRWVIGVGRSF